MSSSKLNGLQFGLATKLIFAGLVVGLLLLYLWTSNFVTRKIVQVYEEDEYTYTPRDSLPASVDGFNLTKPELNVYSDTCTTGFEDDLELRKRYEEKCEYWIHRVQKWKARLFNESHSKNPFRMAEIGSVVQVSQDRNGAGDRLMGAFTAFDLALGHGKRVNLYWENLDYIFRPSCELSHADHSDPPYFVITGAPEDKAINYRGGCKKRTFYRCGLEAHIYDKCPVYNRACFSSSRCQQINDIYQEKLTMAHIVGCPLRMMLAPRPSFFNFPITWFINGDYVNGTVREFLTEMKRYNVIAVHGRMGDGAFRFALQRARQKYKPIVQDFLMCANWLNGYAVRSNFTKKTKFLVASDDVSMKETFKKKFPRKTITISMRPQHIVKSNKLHSTAHKVKVLTSLFAEWYAIGKADQLITNVGHSFGISSFSRSAWLYNLKSQYYELRFNGRFCFLREFTNDGNAALISGKCMKQNPLLKHGVGPHQSHWPESGAGYRIPKPPRYP